MSPESSVSILNSLASLEVTHLLSPEGPLRSLRGHVWFLTIDLRRPDWNIPYHPRQCTQSGTHLIARIIYWSLMHLLICKEEYFANS